MDVGIRLAARNKEIIAQEIMAFLGVDEKDGAIKTNHNYYDRGEPDSPQRRGVGEENGGFIAR